MTDRTLNYLFVALWVVFAVALIFLPGGAHGRDLGQWGNNDPAISEWYRSLMQPDSPTISCCGESDAYWCDDIHVRTGTDNQLHTYCRITDDRDDAPRMRPHRDIGEEFEIPDRKLKWDRGNPTGHAVIFLTTGGIVMCFVQTGGF
jgi:hypothetical protein